VVLNWCDHLVPFQLIAPNARKEASKPGTVPAIFVKARQSPVDYTSVRSSNPDKQ